MQRSLRAWRTATRTALTPPASIAVVCVPAGGGGTKASRALGRPEALEIGTFLRLCHFFKRRRAKRRSSARKLIGCSNGRPCAPQPVRREFRTTRSAWFFCDGKFLAGARQALVVRTAN